MRVSTLRCLQNVKVLHNANNTDNAKAIAKHVPGVFSENDWAKYHTKKQSFSKVGFNPFRQKPRFLPVCDTILLKTLWEKDKLLVMSNFSFSHNVFYQSREVFAIYIKVKIVICKLFQFEPV